MQGGMPQHTVTPCWETLLPPPVSADGMRWSWAHYRSSRDKQSSRDVKKQACPGICLRSTPCCEQATEPPGHLMPCQQHRNSIIKLIRLTCYVMCVETCGRHSTRLPPFKVITPPWLSLQWGEDQETKKPMCSANQSLLIKPCSVEVDGLLGSTSQSPSTGKYCPESSDHAKGKSRWMWRSRQQTIAADRISTASFPFKRLQSIKRNIHTHRKCTFCTCMCTYVHVEHE